MKKILYVDMDGVVADFDKAVLDLHPELSDIVCQQEKHDKVDEICEANVDIFHHLEPIEGAIMSVKILSEYYDVYFLSTPMWKVPESFTGKRIWLENHFGELANKKLILTHRKDLNIGEYLIDDRINNGAGSFRGEHIHFRQEGFETWDKVVVYLLKKIHD